MAIEQGTRRHPPEATVAQRRVVVTGQPRIDLGPVVQAIARELGGAVPAERIEALLQELLEHEFCDVRVTTFVPIFLHRVACETLRRELPPQPGSHP